MQRTKGIADFYSTTGCTEASLPLSGLAFIEFDIFLATEYNVWSLPHRQAAACDLCFEFSKAENNKHDDYFNTHVGVWYNSKDNTVAMALRLLRNVDQTK